MVLLMICKFEIVALGAILATILVIAGQPEAAKWIGGFCFGAFLISVLA